MPANKNPSAARREPDSATPGRLVLRPANDPRRRTPKQLGVTDAGPARRVVLPVADARTHLHLAGATGKGKSTLLLHLALADIEAGRGVAVIEPRGDLIRDLLDRMPRESGERLVLIDPDETQAPPALNVLDPAGLGGEIVAEHLVSTLHRIYSASWGPRVEDTLRAAAFTLAQRPGSTLADIPLLLTNARYRHEVTGRIKREDPVGIGGFWTSYDRLTPSAAAAQAGPVLSKLRAVTARRFVADLFGTATSSFVPADILDGGILLARLPKGELGEDLARLVGSLLVASLWQAAIGRSHQPEHDRADATVMIDEAQNFLHLPTPLGDALAESRGYHLGWVLAHQHLGQLTPELATALDANARNKSFFGVSPDDARHLAAHVGPHLDASDLARLAPYQAAVRLSIDNRDTAGFTMRTLPPPPVIDGRADELRAAARAHGIDRAIRDRDRSRRMFATRAPATDPDSGPDEFD
ncbi:type IV secretory system conjugative DNA transfer family protein [Amycolatopsis rubida]|uniref:type IV secretory system conjugative DNA transfer family protein n=1 Tax=Amycolatopsis rubida TaxID=112413 RepID=UPI000B828BAD|nr:type IV secretory system conjugative DNA transfer family protein [Amycolatopsis rubida]